MVDQTATGTQQSSQGTTTQSATAQGTGADSAVTSQSQAGQASTGQTAPTRPDWAPETAWKPDTGLDADAFGKHWNEKVLPVITRDAAEQSRRLSLPQKPEDYKLELPKDFKAPDGVEFKLDPTKPEYGKLQAWAHKHGATPEAVSELTGVYAALQVAEHTSYKAAAAAEVAKLGSAGQTRVDAIATWMTGALGEDGKTFANILKQAPVASTVTLFEKIMRQMTTQGAGTFSRTGTEPPGGGKIENFAGMTFEQRRFAQDQARQRRA